MMVNPPFDVPSNATTEAEMMPAVVPEPAGMAATTAPTPPPGTQLPATPDANERAAITLTLLRDEYVTIMDDTAKISDRRQVSNNIFVGLNSLFLTGMGVVFTSSHFMTWGTTGIFAGITLFTVVFNGVWLSLLTRYRRLVGVRLAYLRALEDQLRASDVFPTITVIVSKKPTATIVVRGVYSLEEDQFYSKLGKHLGFSQHERFLAFLFIATYLAATGIVAGLTWAMMHGWLPKGLLI